MGFRLLSTGLLVGCVALTPRAVPAQEVLGAIPDTVVDSSGAPLTSQTVIRGGLLRELPVDDPRQALTLAPGVVMRSGDIGIASAPDLSLRGADPGTASVYIDGAPVRFQTLGIQQIALGTNAISRVAVVTGVASALATDASGGVITYVTRAGGSRFAGSFRAASDSRFPDGASVGYNRFEGSLGGPLPLAPHLTWFVSGALYGQRSDYRGLGAADLPTYVIGGLDTMVTVIKGDGSGVQSIAMPKFVQYSGQCASESNEGFECQGLRRPMDWSTARRGQGKLLYTYGAGSSLSFTGVMSDLDRRFFPGRVIGDPSLYHGAREASRLGVANWTQGLSRSSQSSLTLHVNLSLATDEHLNGPLDPASELATRDPALGINFSPLRFTAADIIPFPLTDQIIRNVRTHQGLTVPFNGRSDLLATQPYRMNPFGLSAAAGWYTAGVDDGGLLTQVWERRWNGRAFIEWRRDSLHRVSFGADVERTDLSYYTATLTDELGLDAFLEHPRRWGVFADYRVQPGRLVIDAGVRLDRFDQGAVFSKSPGFISRDPAWSPFAFMSDTAYANSVARVFDPAKVQSILTPRVRVGYAVSRHTSIRMGLGQQVERPSFQSNFGHVNSDFVFTSASSALFGRDVDYVKSTLLEFGVKQSLGSHVVVDGSVYSKSHVQPYGFRVQRVTDPITGGTRDVNVLVPAGEDGMGFDARLEWRPAPSMNTSIAYSLLRRPGAGAGSDFTTSALSGLLLLRVPDTWKAGTVLGSALQNLSAVATFRLTSGLPYTRLVNVGAGTLAPDISPLGQLAEPINSSRRPVTKTVDLRLAKRIHSRGIDLNVYADFRNLLNFQNTLGLFAETGTTENDSYRQRIEAPEIAALRSEAQNNSALMPDGSVDVRGCAGWMGDAGPVNCVALKRVETRFGDGNGIYSPAEQQKTLDTYFDSFLGSWRFLGTGRTARVGIELRF